MEHKTKTEIQIKSNKISTNYTSSQSMNISNDGKQDSKDFLRNQSENLRSTYYTKLWKELHHNFPE
jgi:hypothetical protein